MAIKGLTCREARSSGAIEVLGKLRKGAPKAGNRPGADLDYFRFDSGDARLTDIIHGLYGDRPGDSFENGIKFFFAKADIEENMPTTMAAYKGGSCWVMCDREEILGERNPQAQWVKYPAHRRPKCRFPSCVGTDSCKATGKLRIVIPEFNRFGVVEVVIGALNDLEHVSKQLAEIEARVAEHGGDLSKVPLRLYRKTRSISCPNGEGKRARREKSMVEVAIDAEFMGRSLQVREQYALASASSLGSMPALPAITQALDTANFEDEFGERVNSDFKQSELWGKIVLYFEQCRCTEQVQRALEKGIACVEDGKLPREAIAALRVRAERANARIEESGVQPIEVEYVQAPPTVLERFEAIASRTGHTMAEIEFSANAARLPENIALWSESECQLLRDRLYAFCDASLKVFESTDASGAEYHGFVESASVDLSDDEAVWIGWRSIF